MTQSQPVVNFPAVAPRKDPEPDRDAVPRCHFDYFPVFWWLTVALLNGEDWPDTWLTPCGSLTSGSLFICPFRAHFTRPGLEMSPWRLALLSTNSTEILPLVRGDALLATCLLQPTSKISANSRCPEGFFFFFCFFFNSDVTFLSTQLHQVLFSRLFTFQSAACLVKTLNIQFVWNIKTWEISWAAVRSDDNIRSGGVDLSGDVSGTSTARVYVARVTRSVLSQQVTVVLLTSQACSQRYFLNSFLKWFHSCVARRVWALSVVLKWTEADTRAVHSLLYP